MPRGLQRLQESRQSHFVTFSCYHRQANFDSPEVYDLFLRGVEQMRQRLAMCIYGYVVMSEHVHLLVSEAGRAIALPVRAHSLQANLESSVQAGSTLTWTAPRAARLGSSRSAYSQRLKPTAYQLFAGCGKSLPSKKSVPQALKRSLFSTVCGTTKVVPSRFLGP
jgi:hypothetical protein